MQKKLMQNFINIKILNDVILIIYEGNQLIKIEMH